MQVSVLAMNGDKDLQVSGPENLEAIERALRDGGNSIVELSNLNHLFQTSEAGSLSGYATITETFSPVALDVLRAWLEAHTTAATAVVEVRADEVPTDFVLAQNYPNPFNGSTIISFTFPRAGPVELGMCNGLGQRVASLVNGMRTVSSYTLHFDGRDARGCMLASGTYLYRLETSQWTQTRQLLFLR